MKESEEFEKELFQYVKTSLKCPNCGKEEVASNGVGGRTSESNPRRLQLKCKNSACGKKFRLHAVLTGSLDVFKKPLENNMSLKIESQPNEEMIPNGESFIIDDDMSLQISNSDEVSEILRFESPSVRNEIDEQVGNEGTTKRKRTVYDEDLESSAAAIEKNGFLCQTSNLHEELLSQKLRFEAKLALQKQKFELIIEEKDQKMLIMKNELHEIQARQDIENASMKKRMDKLELAVLTKNSWANEVSLPPSCPSDEHFPVLGTESVKPQKKMTYSKITSKEPTAKRMRKVSRPIFGAPSILAPTKIMKLHVRVNLDKRTKNLKRSEIYRYIRDGLKLNGLSMKIKEISLIGKNVAELYVNENDYVEVKQKMEELECLIKNFNVMDIPSFSENTVHTLKKQIVSRVTVLMRRNIGRGFRKCILEGFDEEFKQQVMTEIENANNEPLKKIDKSPKDAEAEITNMNFEAAATNLTTQC